MRVVLRWLRNRGDQIEAAERSVETERLTLGRGTEQHVELADMRLGLRHAEIHLYPRATHMLHAVGRHRVWVNEAPARIAVIGPGDVIDLGRFRLRVGEAPPGTVLLLEIEERYSAREDRERRLKKLVLTLDRAGWRKRRPALIAAGALLLLGLLAPLALRHLPFTHAQVPLDRIWEAGPPSSAHVHFIGDCNTCHQVPFVRVRNAACLACHTDVSHHSDDIRILSLHEFAGARCGDCHQEHAGAALTAREPRLCTDCHAKPERFGRSDLQPVRDFSAHHPEFSLSLPRGNRRVEVRQDAPAASLRDDSNLKFPHDVHLDPRGVAMPGGRKHMVCGDCHTPAGAGFVPVTMERNCIACHRLDFDPDDPARVLPHALPAQVVATVRDHYARIALAGEVKQPDAPELLRRPRAPDQVLTPEQTQAALSWADAKSATVLKEVFERRLCSECHVVTVASAPAPLALVLGTTAATHAAAPAPAPVSPPARALALALAPAMAQEPEPAMATPPAAAAETEAPWTVAAVALTQRYFTGARFDHAAHRSQPCTLCHAQAPKSHDADEVMIPRLDTCRECHADSGTAHKVQTVCADCHGYHTARSDFLPPATLADPLLRTGTKP